MSESRTRFPLTKMCLGLFDLLPIPTSCPGLVAPTLDQVFCLPMTILSTVPAEWGRMEVGTVACHCVFVLGPAIFPDCVTCCYKTYTKSSSQSQGNARDRHMA